MPGRTNGLGETSITFANNIIRGGKPVSVQGNYSNPMWRGNILWNTSAGSIPADGYKIVNPGLVPDKSGLLRLIKDSPAIEAGTGEYFFVSIDIDGQPGKSAFDTGADQSSDAPAINRPLNISDVGPDAQITQHHMN